MKKPLTQNELIKAYLLGGKKLNPLHALNKFGTFRLSARIFELRNKGITIESQLIQLPNGKAVSEYWLNKAEIKRLKKVNK
jgi:hypothetical protein